MAIASENELIYDLFSFYIHTSLSQTQTQDSSNSTEIVIMPPLRAVEQERNELSLEAQQLKGQNDTLESQLQQASGTIAQLQQEHNELSLEGQHLKEQNNTLESQLQQSSVTIMELQQERSELSLEEQQLKGQNNSLESQLQQASGTIAELQQEISRLENHAEAASLRAEDLSANLSAARKDLETQRQDSQETVMNEREKARTKELDLVASITERDDQLEALQEEIMDQRKNSQMLLSQKDEEANQLISKQVDKDKEGEMLTQLQLEDETLRSQSLVSSLAKLEEDLRREQEAFADLENQLSAATVEHIKQNEEISSLQVTMQTAASNAAKELQTKEKRIHSLEKKVQQLRNERAAKAREFSEAQQHIGRLMNVMGFRPEPDSARAPSKQTRTRSIARPSQAAATQQTQPTEDEIFPTQPEDPLGTSFEINMSPPMSSRSPKRSRENAFPTADSPSPPVMTDKKPKEASCRRGVTPRQKRTPLEDSDQNSQSCSQQSYTSQRSERGMSQKGPHRASADENQLHPLELDMDLEFSKDFLFTSTSLSGANNDRQSFSETQQ
ncbi:hypothetical protein BO71DRAFT_437883 [Aspergillus ellipticus CBS 707.79]|uniref:Uncharacterized protein n=1 Tax=Aspergillus ellipticus CBS 707.79 TaxID=1448320 RepID=A0A319DMK1_9EURO|nr:hypothetical protein BO71DRAFT_437883 [Aspergillus ellipticus CBS 707.79]